MVETSRRYTVRRPLPPSLIVAPLPPEPLVIDEVQEALLRFVTLSARARATGEADLATWIGEAGLLAAASRLRRGDEARSRHQPLQPCLPAAL